ncbi:glucose/sorbosone family PQQ-dependent dehydrogenase [Testudinibacter sp. TR-2022]|uniref:glucose/sorbosone family PQQ-dependent dehydrogenase n=1 Tax=Testudinibacter sp. TR-2022 TaxID=2585029 RepID=UPI00111AA92F|nr:glucose/sorbosone family PQQ-dependent dehydrogenase [Testudinibacter sp. TR-2022]TNH05396.1 dehydrogenase [Pasteurellaceae bacterium Phil11]TNH23338.1 dehydrogenase [Testudinibacter sp. TR-2022]TNH27852.1 dehydrogenase [Testudinibacter sp. TR-2022]
MQKSLLATALLAMLISGAAIAKVDNPTVAMQQDEIKASVLIDGLNNVWEMKWGANGDIWATTRQGKEIVAINPATGASKVLYTFDKAFAEPVHQGVLGMELHPNFAKGTGEDYVYVYYTYSNSSKDKSDFGRVVRLSYDAKKDTLGDEQIVLDKTPAGNDHNGGRLLFDKSGKLLLSLGDNGYNQYSNTCKEIQSQKIPTAAEVAANDFNKYRGKVIRFNLDGSIPSDNPEINGVKSHIYAYGFRNPQGLVYVGDTLYNTDQGPAVDDEINIVEAAGNYGWPHIAGYQDDMAYSYANFSAAPNCAELPEYIGVPNGAVVPEFKESEFQANNLKFPQKTFYTVPQGYNFNDEKCEIGYICWPTVATTSIAYYPKDGKIKSLQNSLLVTGVKTGTLYQLPLSADGKQVQGESITHFRTDNRYRMVLVSPDTRKIYIATDDAGILMGKDIQPVMKVANKGAILVFEAK